MAGTDIWVVQRSLSRWLVAWGASSVAAGVLLRQAGRRSGSRELELFGRQNAVWGAIDAAIAVFGSARSRSRLRELADPSDPEVLESERASLHRLLVANAVLDVGYVAGGAWWARNRSVGDGSAVVLQGAFLLVLDTVYARRTRRSRR